MTRKTTSIAEEVTAEIQMAVKGEQEKLSNQNKIIRDFTALSKEFNLIRSIDSEDCQRVVTAIATDHASRPAYSGLLYGAVAVRVDMELDGHDIVDVAQDARSTIELCDFGDSIRRMRWSERTLATELMNEAVSQEYPPDMILYDGSLTITRQDMLTYDESPAKPAWERMLDGLDDFWRTTHSELSPWQSDGPVIVGLSQMRANLFFTALRDADNNNSKFISSVAPALSERLSERWDEVMQVGPNRLIDVLLDDNQHTIAYPYRGTQLDRRWLPEELKTLGVNGLFVKFGRDVAPTHLELLGQPSVMGTEYLNRVISMYASLYWLESVGTPVPMWYAQKAAEFPSDLLDLYYKKLNTDTEDGT